MFLLNKRTTFSFGHSLTAIYILFLRLEQVWNVSCVYTFKQHTRGDKNKIRGKVPPFLYSLFKRDAILTYKRAMHIQLIDIDDASVNRPRALQQSSRSRDIA